MVYSMRNEESLEEIEKLIIELQEDNKTIPIVVEGEKDRDALRKLGILGEIIRFNRGKTISDFCDMIAQNYTHIIILTDWDRKGGFLCMSLRKNLESRVKCDIYYREHFARLSMTKTVEGLPSWIDTLKKKTNHVKQC